MNLHEYQDELEQLKQNMHEIELHCENNKTSICYSTVEEMYSLIAKTESIQQLIKTNMESRSKRSFATFAVSALGSVLGYIGSKWVDQVSGTEENKLIEEMHHQQISIVQILNEDIKNLAESNKKRTYD